MKTWEPVINEEQAFPIYKIIAKWTEKNSEELPFENSTEQLFMTKKRLSNRAQKLKVKQFCEKVHEKKNDKKIENLTCTIAFLGYETWVITWFQHQRFDLNETDEDVLKSFRNFIKRQIAGGKKDHLMGADEEFRWHSGSLDYEGIPCRCSHCKEAGFVRIAH